MKKILIVLLAMVVLIGCTSHSTYIRNNPNLLKPGLHASAFREVWGEPDEIMSYLDYQNKQAVYGERGGWRAGGNRYGWSGGGGWSGSGTTYTPTMFVWIYKSRCKVLSFEQGRINLSGVPLPTAWSLVGFQSLKDCQQGIEDKRVETPRKEISEPKVKEQKPEIVSEKRSRDSIVTNVTPIQDKKIVTVTCTFANIRQGDGDNYFVVTTVKEGDKLTVIEKSREWFNVRLESGLEGWISNKDVK